MCPCCGSAQGEVIDRKFLHSLVRCGGCRILYRYPGEPAAVMADFYQHEYAEPGLTSEMPSEAELSRLLANNFQGSGKDYGYHIAILQALGLKKGDRLLDYGASWGYATYQFQKAGFAADAFEVSVPRAAYGKRFGLEIKTRAEEIQSGYDAIYSCHVLEHVPNPLAALRQMLAWVRPGGMVVAHTPNGSAAWRRANRRDFHSCWGRVHPFLLTDEFLTTSFPGLTCYISSDDRPEQVATWDRSTSRIENPDRFGLFFVLIRPSDMVLLS